MILQHFNKLERPPFYLIPFMKVTTRFLYAEYGRFLHNYDAVGFLSPSLIAVCLSCKAAENGTRVRRWCVVRTLNVRVKQATCSSSLFL